jgi:hypothetical protein
MELPNSLLNLLRHQLYSPRRLTPSHVFLFVRLVFSRTVFDIFLDQVRRASRDLSEVQAQRCPASCLGDTTATGEQVQLGLEYESSRQSSDGFHNPFSSGFMWGGWVSSTTENSAARPLFTPRGFF